VTKHWGGYVNITHPKESYDKVLNMCNQLEDPGDEEEAEEREIVRTMCIKAFFLLLAGLTIFANKNSKNVQLIWLTALQDLDTVREWSWGGMTLNFLYSQISLTTYRRLAPLVVT